jgi:hypothetical protein
MTTEEFALYVGTLVCDAEDEAAAYDKGGGAPSSKGERIEFPDAERRVKARLARAKKEAGRRGAESR